MLSFLKPKRDFYELPKKERFEKILEKYIAPKLIQLGFVWIKEKRFEQDILDFMAAEFNRPLLEHECYSSHSFERERGEILDRISLSWAEYNGRLLFHSDWHIEYIPYDDWHMKVYGEELSTYNLYVWSDIDDKRIGTKFRKKYKAFYEFDLSRYSTKDVMEYFLNQSLNIRVPEMEKYNSMPDLIALFELLDDPNNYEVLFDFYVMEKQYDKAEKALKWGLKILDPKNEYLKTDEDYILRDNYLKSVQ